jgi:D-alanyl-D-alanine carboxypeptidase/D-alanyl-D-alanine-endopeptidase (penicillin-binding protein 4)
LRVDAQDQFERVSEPEIEPRREASLSSIELPVSASSRLLRRAPALLGLSVVLGLLWWGAWHRGHDRDPRHDRPIDESVATAWSRGVVLIPTAPPPASSAERLEARLSAFARHVERIRASIDPPLVAFGSEALREELEQVIARVDDRAEVSVHIRDIDSGRVLFDYYGDTLLNPASNLKLLTTSAALDLLGPDYVFETRVLRVGETLYLVGEGDPTIDAEALAGLTKLVADRVPTTTVSEIVVDDSAFSPRVFGPGYAEGGWGAAYMAPSGALSVNFNTVEVTVHRVGGTKLPAVRLEPHSTHVIVDNRATLGSQTRLEIRSHSEATIGIDPPAREQTLTRIEIEGSLAKSSRGYKVRRRVVDPGMFAGGAFAQMLASEHVSELLPVRAGVAPRVEKPAPDLRLPRIVGRDAQGRDIWLIAERRSPPLLEIASGLLSYSNNFIAEQILRTLGWRMTGDPGGWENGGQVVRGYWAALGNDPGALVYENGSGLSSTGRVTTTGLVDLMAVAARTQSAGSSLIDALPVAGADGTVRTRLRRSGKRVRAKTGTLAGVSGLTGVITTEEGVPRVAFSILINVRDTDRMAAATRRKTEDAIVMTVLDHIDGWEMIRGTLVTDLPPLSVTP